MCVVLRYVVLRYGAKSGVDAALVFFLLFELITSVGR